jgi:hypothetical protein
LWNISNESVFFYQTFLVRMEREYNQFTPELLKMMRDEEREKFLAALKDGASWAQLYQIRNTIRKLNDLIDTAETNISGSTITSPGVGSSSTPAASTATASTRGEEENPRSASSLA